jgi:hypothetical protein
MDPISNADRLVQMLRQRLEERSKAKETTKAPKTGKIARRSPDAVRAIAGQFARSGVDDEQLRRSIVEQLLADQFDPALVNEPKFQQVVDRVTETMESDPGVKALLGKVVAELRAVT